MSSNNDTNQQSDSKQNQQSDLKTNQQSTSNYRRNQSSYNNRPIRKKNSSYFNEKPVFSCLVCCSDFPSFKYKAIFAIGQCNHMVCYYCSTKMRVLCEQNECPICRQELAEVIFTTNKDMKFTKLETKKCIEYNSRYKIYFENELCLSEFYRLQEYACQICHNNDTIFLNLKELEDHLKKKHDLYLCKLCVTHLKVFPSERKYYNKRDLNRHEKTGDLDNKSYKGHPSCNLCNTMFFDEDFLLSHLKRDHFFCQFCGTKMFFDNYSSLKKHFYDKHFVCEEGLCKDEEFTSAFANKFDLQAHKAQVHGSGKINRAMIVDLDFTSNEQDSPNIQNSYQHRNFYSQNHNNYDYEEEQGAVAQALPTEEDFPQLATPSNLAGASSSNYATMTKNIVSSTKNKPTNFSSKFQTPNSNTEDFPALASGSTVPLFAQTKLPAKQNHKIPPKKPVTKLTAKANNPNTSKNPSNQQPANLKYADIASAFPPLANAPINESWSKPLPTFNLQDDFPDMPIKIKKTKKKTQYVNLQKEAEEQKRKEEEAKKQQQKENELNGNKSELDQQDQNGQFNNPLTNDGKMLSLKVPPGLHNLSNNNNNKSLNNNNLIRKAPPGFKEKEHQPVTSISNNTFDMSEINNMAIELINSENNKSVKENNSSKNTNNHNSNKDNFNKNLPSSSKTGYIYPSNFNERNEILLKLVKEQLRTENKFDQFRTLTDKFIRSHIDGDFYFRKCLDLFDKNFLNLIFSELLVLMPHIKKQTEILSAYEKYFNYNKGAMQKRNQSGSKGVWILTNEKIEFLVCPTCQQVLGLNDGSEHMANHNDLNRNK